MIGEFILKGALRSAWRAKRRAVIFSLLLVFPAFSLFADEEEPILEERPAYLAVSFLPVSGLQIPAVVHSLGNDYAYYREEESGELRELDTRILEDSPVRMVLDGRVVKEFGYDARGRGNQLGDTVFLIPVAPGEHLFRLEIVPGFDPVEVNFLGREIEVRPAAVARTAIDLTVKIEPGMVRHLQIEDFAVDLGEMKEEADGRAIFGLKYWLAFNLEEAVYPDPEAVLAALSEIKQGWRLNLELLPDGQAGAIPGGRGTITAGSDNRGSVDLPPPEPAVAEETGKLPEPSK